MTLRPHATTKLVKPSIDEIYGEGTQDLLNEIPCPPAPLGYTAVSTNKNNSSPQYTKSKPINEARLANFLRQQSDPTNPMMIPPMAYPQHPQNQYVLPPNQLFSPVTHQFSAPSAMAFPSQAMYSLQNSFVSQSAYPTFNGSSHQNLLSNPYSNLQSVPTMYPSQLMQSYPNFNPSIQTLPSMYSPQFPYHPSLFPSPDYTLGLNYPLPMTYAQRPSFAGPAAEPKVNRSPDVVDPPHYDVAHYNPSLDTLEAVEAINRRGQAPLESTVNNVPGLTPRRYLVTNTGKVPHKNSGNWRYSVGYNNNSTDKDFSYLPETITENIIQTIKECK